MEMEKIKESERFFKMDVKSMPYGPNELVIPAYAMPNTYGRHEQEEAAARIIIECQKVGNWCGISISYLLDIIEQESKIFYSGYEIRKKIEEYNLKEKIRYNHKFLFYILFCVTTLGIYFLIGKKPKEPEFKIIPDISAPFSATYIFGPNHVMRGLMELKERGMIRIEKHNDSFEIIFPTKKFLEPIGDKYKK